MILLVFCLIHIGASDIHDLLARPAAKEPGQFVQYSVDAIQSTLLNLSGCRMFRDEKKA